MVKHWIHSCVQQLVAAVWLRSQRARISSWYSAPATTPCTPRIQSLTHSPRQVAMAPGVIFESKIALSAGVILKCTIHKNCTPRTQSLTHSFTRLSRQLAMAREVIFESEMASSAGDIVQCTIHKNLNSKNSITHALSSTGGHGAWSNLWAYNCLARRCYLKHWIHSCFQQQLAIWFSPQPPALRPGTMHHPHKN
jgi:hypothetical protein